MIKKIYFILFFILLLLINITAAGAYEMEMETLADTIAKQIAKTSRKQVQRVAVVDFTDLQGNVTELGRFIAEELSVNLARSGKHFEIIDRMHLKSVIEEHKFNMSGLVDPQTAKQLGKIAGVDAIVTGKLTPFGDNVRVSCAVIATATAKMIASGKTSIAKTRTIEQLLAGGGIGLSMSVEKDQDRDAERQQRARDTEMEKADKERAALDKLREEQRKLDAERRRLEDERLNQEQLAKDREKLDKIYEEQRKLEAERLRIEEERKKMADASRKPADVPKKLSPLQRSYVPIATKESGDLIFDLTGAKISGDEITVSMEVINKSEEAKNIAFYDEAYRWTKSRLTDDRDKPATVTKVFFWKGDQQTTMYRLGNQGITVDPKSAVTAQLVFTKVKPDVRMLKTLILHPYVGHRIAFVWRWLDMDITFDNIRLARGK